MEHKGCPSIHVKATSTSSFVVTRTWTLSYLIQCDGVVTMLMAALGLGSPLEDVGIHVVFVVPIVAFPRVDPKGQMTHG